jgi:hypothetical protein
MKEIFNNFIWITKLLNTKGITPVLYGSLGLYQIIEPLGKVDDIDFLIPDIWLTDKWPEFRSFLESHGFKMDNDHEHEFSHPDVDVWVAFGSLEEAKKHSGLDADKLGKAESFGTHYLTLSADQYLAAYEASLTDNYRQDRKGDADILKIQAIKDYLQSSK